MIDFSRNHFALFGLPERFRSAPDALDRAYRALQTEVHPDRFAAAAESERRVALQASARVNEAYRTLKDPVARAEYLLALRDGDASSADDRKLPLSFLELQLERRERADLAARARDAATLEALLAEVRRDAKELEEQLAGLLDTDAAWGTARATAREFRFLSKLGADLDAMLDGLDD
jgi:molecular chaperone HscB